MTRRIFLCVSGLFMNFAAAANAQQQVAAAVSNANSYVGQWASASGDCGGAYPVNFTFDRFAENGRAVGSWSVACINKSGTFPDQTATAQLMPDGSLRVDYKIGNATGFYVFRRDRTQLRGLLQAGSGNRYEVVLNPTSR